MSPKNKIEIGSHAMYHSVPGMLSCLLDFIIYMRSYIVTNPFPPPPTQPVVLSCCCPLHAPSPPPLLAKAPLPNHACQQRVDGPVRLRAGGVRREESLYPSGEHSRGVVGGGRLEAGTRAQGGMIDRRKEKRRFVAPVRMGLYPFLICLFSGLF